MFVFNISIVSFIAMYLAGLIFAVHDTQSILEGKFTDTNSLNAFLFIQGLSSLGGFMLTAMMFSVLETGEFKHHLRLTTYPSLKMIALAIASIFAAQFFIEFLVTVNKQIPLPSKLHFLYDYQKHTEEITNAMMSFKDFGHLLFVSFVVAVIPAVGEEFFFRGLLLGDMLKARITPLASIIITGFIFSIFHFEVHNVLAIWALGSFLGYLYYVSGSLWLPIAAHFTNNFLAVLLKYLFNLGVISEDVANAETPLYATIIGIAIFIAFVFVFSKWKKPVNFVEVDENIDTPIQY